MDEVSFRPQIIEHVQRNAGAWLRRERQQLYQDSIARRVAKCQSSDGKRVCCQGKRGRHSCPAGSVVPRKTGPIITDKTKLDKTSRWKLSYDFEIMVNGLQRLNEEGLLNILQLIHDHKTKDTFIKYDVETGDMSVDLWTLSEPLAVKIWQFLVSRFFLLPLLCLLYYIAVED